MTERSLQVTYRRGRAFGAYLHLSHATGEKSAKNCSVARRAFRRRLQRVGSAGLVMNADGSQRSILFGDPERNARAPVWSPRGDRIASGVGRFFQVVQGPSTADIAVMNVDGKDVRILTNGSANYGFPSWSPDGVIGMATTRFTRSVPMARTCGD